MLLIKLKVTDAEDVVAVASLAVAVKVTVWGSVALKLCEFTDNKLLILIEPVVRLTPPLVLFEIRVLNVIGEAVLIVCAAAPLNVTVSKPGVNVPPELVKFPPIFKL